MQAKKRYVLVSAGVCLLLLFYLGGVQFGQLVAARKGCSPQLVARENAADNPPGCRRWPAWVGLRQPAGVHAMDEEEQEDGEEDGEEGRCWRGDSGSWQGDSGCELGDSGCWRGDSSSWQGGSGSWRGDSGSWLGDSGCWPGDSGSWPGDFVCKLGDFGQAALIGDAEGKMKATAGNPYAPPELRDADEEEREEGRGY